MKYRLSRCFFLLIAIFLSGQVVAQNIDTAHNQKVYTSNSSFRTWSIGVSAGISTPYTLVGYNARQDFSSPDMQLGYSIYFKNQLTNSFGLQADLMAGKLKADHSNEKFPNGQWIYEQFTSKINWSASLSGNFVILHWGVVQPYLTIGGGVLNYSPILHPSYPSVTTAPVYNTLNSFFVPIGLGVKVNVAKGINFDFGYQVNFVMADNLDGYKYGPTNDRFSYTHAGLEFALGEKSKKQLATELITIPVQNRILVHDQTLIDTLQEQQSQLAAEKEKNTRLKNDLDAANASIAKLTADSDGDGIPDVYDKCPNTPPNTKVDASGCPLPGNVVAGTKSEITGEDKINLAIFASSIEFYSGTEIIIGRSFPSLNAVSRMMIDKKFLLKVDVYADRNVSSDNDFRLAQLRAEAVKNYLVNKGVDASKIETQAHRGFPPDISPLKKRRMANIGQVVFTIVP